MMGIGAIIRWTGMESSTGLMDASTKEPILMTRRKAMACLSGR